MPTGTVSSFDKARGLGTVTAGDGRVFAFHCTAIADGSRAVELDAQVRYELMPRLGVYEANAIEPARGRLVAAREAGTREDRGI